MRAKPLGGDRAATSTKPAHPTVMAIPHVTQDEDNAAVPKTSNESNHDPVDVREVGSKVNVDNIIDDGTNRSPREGLGQDHFCIDVLDRKICICCNEGGEVLVCGERGCPVTVHAKCISCEPKFDDMGNFYCSYCWLKRALVELQELRNKALVAKKDLSNFLDNNVITSNKLAQIYGEAKRKGPKELSLVGNGSCLDCRSRQGNDSVHKQPLQRVEEQQKEMEGETASADQHEIAVEDETHANAPAANTGDSMHYREEKTPEHVDLVDKSVIRENVDVHKISETHESIFVEGKEGIGPRHTSCNCENILEGIPEDEEEASPLSSCHLGKKDGLSPDIAVVKRTRESVPISLDNRDTMQDREKLFQNELEMPAEGSSVSETNDSGSEALLVKKRHVKQRAQKYPQRVTNAEGENEEVTSSRTLGQARVSSKQGRSKKLTLPTRKRKRLRWTTEEENTLKEGVLRFSKENQNIPWRKILEYGCHVFDDTRTPVDLKDKWRTMMAKGGVLSTAGPTPLVSQAAGLMQSSMVVTQQPVPVFQPPSGVHIPHCPPNYIPYGHYFPPFYVPSPAIHQFLGNGAFPPQPQASPVYPPPQAAAATGMKYPLPQHKPGTNATSPAHIVLPSAYGAYGSSPVGYNPSSTGTAVNFKL